MSDFLPILAQSLHDNRVQALRKAFTHQRETQVDTTPIYIAVAVVAALLVVLILIKRKQDVKSRTLSPGRPPKLLSRVLGELGVSFADRVLMHFIARKSGLPHPVVMLFSPRLLDRYAGSFIESLAIPVLRRQARARLQLVAAKCFGPAQQ